MQLSNTDEHVSRAMASAGGAEVRQLDTDFDLSIFLTSAGQCVP